jgi:hypothetical protein
LKLKKRGEGESKEIFFINREGTDFLTNIFNLRGEARRSFIS